MRTKSTYGLLSATCPLRWRGPRFSPCVSLLLQVHICAARAYNGSGCSRRTRQLYCTISLCRIALIGTAMSTSFEHSVELGQVRDLHHVPIQQRLWRDEIARHGGEQDVLDLPECCLMCVLRLVITVFVQRVVEQGLWDVEECELAQESVETRLLRRPVDLRAGVTPPSALQSSHMRGMPDAPADRDASGREAACQDSACSPAGASGGSL